MAKAAQSTTRWIAIAAILHGLAFWLLLPAWMGEDEPWHVEYASYVADGHSPFGMQDLSNEEWVTALESAPYREVQIRRRFPGLTSGQVSLRQGEIVQSMADVGFSSRVDWSPPLVGAMEFDSLAPNFSSIHQPPLYYGVLGALGGALGQGQPRKLMNLGRGLSLSAYALVVLLTFLIARRVLSTEAGALLAASFAMLLPMHARQAAVVNNDVLAKLLSAVLLFLVLGRARLPKARLVLIACLSLLTLATKPTTVVVVVVSILIALLPTRESLYAPSTRTPRSSRLQVAILLLGLGGAAALYVTTLDHGPVISNTWMNFVGRLRGSFSIDFLMSLLGTSAGSFNWQSRPLAPALVMVLGALVCVAAVLFLRANFGLASSMDAEQSRQRKLVRICLLIVVAQVALIALRGVPIGRYLAPALPAMCILVGSLAALRAPSHRAPGILLAAFLLLVAFSSYFLWAGLVFNQYVVLGS
jgi:hypothetical protein